ncbi:MAG: transporter substrate-binding protein, partial [Paenibacillus sp.]|nr:transporter substrate-binding protein [Paenibacillus sp.]
MAGALAVGLTACGGNNNAGTNEGTGGSNTGGDKGGEKATITFQNIYPDPSDPKYKMIRTIVANYEKDHPNVKIELDSLNTDQQKQKLKTQAASKEMPDITIVNPAAQMQPFVEADLFAPLNEMVEQNGLKDTFQKGILDYYTFDGNLYALPDGNNIGLVYYNKALFKQAGVEVPTTFEGMVEAAKTLKAAGITPIAIGEKDSWT